MDSKLFNSTKEAYSFNRYSKQGWKACIKYLLQLNFSEECVIAFMCSKHTRWAGDLSGEDYGNLGLKTLKNYFKQYPEYSTPEYTLKNLLD